VTRWQHQCRLSFAPVRSRIRAVLSMALPALDVLVACRINNTRTFLIAWVTLTAVALSPSAAKAQPAPVPASAHCRSESPFRYSSAHSSWTGWSTSATNTRFQGAAGAGLRARNVPKLKLKWAFALADESNARSQPAVDNGRIFFGTGRGAVYSLDARSGCIEWTTRIAGAIRSALVIGPTGHGSHAAIYFGAGHNAYALDATTGKQLWKVPIAETAAAMITAAPLLHQGVLYFGLSSFEERLAASPSYQCCTFRGSVVALKADTGKLLWQTYTIPSAPKPTENNKTGVQMYGPSGAAVWSTPTFDAKQDRLYVATGDNYSQPATKTSDAVLALNAKNGRMLWRQQLTSGDAYNIACLYPGPQIKSANCPPPAGPDFDFGQPPILVSLGGGRRELVIGQKSGVVYALDPDRDGAIVWRTRVGKGGTLGGVMWGSATDGRNLYVAVSDLRFNGIELPNPNEGGGLFALDLKTGNKAWGTLPPRVCGDLMVGCSPAQSQAVTAIPGVVFSGSMDGHMRAYATSDGKILWDFDTHRQYTTVTGEPANGGSLNGPGPVVADGMVYVNSGYGLFGGMEGNVLLAFSMNGH
jgi:polyvinyl alcohol dehydrogenase (cytochrome)